MVLWKTLFSAFSQCSPLRTVFFKEQHSVTASVFLEGLQGNHFYIGYPHCVKSVQIRSFSGPYFPAFGLNTERYNVSVCIQSECGKIQTRKNSIFGHFSYSACAHKQAAIGVQISTMQTQGVEITLIQCCFNVTTLKQRWTNVISTLCVCKVTVWKRTRKTFTMGCNLSKITSENLFSLYYF